MPKSKPVVALIEDDLMIGEMYKAKFAKNGFEIQIATDGAAGLELVKKIKPDIILLDIIMPKLDGFEVLKQLRGNPDFKKTPVVMLTNLGQEEDMKKGRDLGATDYFVKTNFIPSAIVDKVKSLLK
ncbi:MAG: response regulator [Candidatus Kerfeldbacteria bacterium CG08_land_8_20_14_0_20_43_14]|uniref:Response regulator n=1 Tax=Candidatus Kerfeldbacteria bacterium CG08_land_8_20_14_0_20_43_14 TaxID=2014246 RepID=A0A2H0YSD3_9BACT|nr:MAG: response regulator [Candidatus Kerfeldbacteria bacterium CG08_land_8_20_14_0_20_43_14]